MQLIHSKRNSSFKSFSLTKKSASVSLHKEREESFEDEEKQMQYTRLAGDSRGLWKKSDKKHFFFQFSLFLLSVVLILFSADLMFAILFPPK